MPRAKKKLTAQQELFIAAYVKRPNATRAAIVAGYSEASAHTIGWEQLQIPDVQAEVQARLKRIAGRYEITADRIIHELAKTALANMADYTSVLDDGTIVNDFTGVDRDQMAAVSEITVEEYVEGRGDNARNVRKTKFKLADRNKALMDLAKLLNVGAVNRREVTGPNGAPVAIESTHNVDIRSLSPEDREALKSVLLNIKASTAKPVEVLEHLEEVEGDED